jgi:glutamate-ammonia-ligase adenylyltransferase
MIDDLLDSLILNRSRSGEELRAELTELCRGVDRPEVIEQILHSFQDKELLRIGVRDLLSMDSIRATTLELSNLAETILREIAQRIEAKMTLRFGVPILSEGCRANEVCRYVILALGKLGGREMSYHSDLDLVLVYEGDGYTVPAPSDDPLTTIQRIDASHYFTELAQRIIKLSSQTGPMGKLYEVDMKLRPTGKSGRLVVPLEEFQRYYECGSAQVWERQALTRTRVVHGDASFGEEVTSVVRKAVDRVSWSPATIDEITGMRQRLEASASPRSLKRAKGGIVDVEFLVQLFHLKYGRIYSELDRANTWEMLDALQAVGLISAEERSTLTDSYSFLRRAEARLRIVTNRPLNEYPEPMDELEKFARRMGIEPTGASAAARFLMELQRHTSATRMLFQNVLTRERK